MSAKTPTVIDTASQHPENYLCALKNHGVIAVSGEERVKYLQGQVTADVEFLNQHYALLACHCDFKGKTWSSFFAAHFNNTIYLIGHQGGLSKSMPELQKYGVFSKVKIEDKADEYQFFGGAGKKLENFIDSWFGDLPFENQQVFADDKGLVMCLTAPTPRYLLMVTPAQASALKAFLKSDISPSQLWLLADIQAGLPHIEEATSNEFVPQMFNMQALNAISFTKGCYMGQETVARTKYLGKNKRAAFILKSDKSIRMQPGDTLELQMGDNWRRGGTVLNCATLNKETWLIAVLPNDTESDAVFRAKDNPAIHFAPQPLPYTFEEPAG